MTLSSGTLRAQQQARSVSLSTMLSMSRPPRIQTQNLGAEGTSPHTAPPEQSGKRIWGRFLRPWCVRVPAADGQAACPSGAPASRSQPHAASRSTTSPSPRSRRRPSLACGPPPRTTMCASAMCSARAPSRASGFSGRYQRTRSLPALSRRCPRCHPGKSPCRPGPSPTGAVARAARRPATTGSRVGWQETPATSRVSTCARHATRRLMDISGARPM